jgi:drug/metabolite transporter (DMT)-like permease
MNSIIPPVEERGSLGISLILLAFLLFTAIDTSAKWLAIAGIPTTEIIFVRYAVHFALIVGFFLPVRRGALMRTKNIKLEVLRGLALLGSTICNFLALQHLPLTMTASISFTMPLILCALSVPLLGESVGWRRWSAIGVGFIGILIIVRPGTTGFHPAAILSLLGAISSAFYFLLTRRLAGVDSAATQQFYTALIAVICVIPFALGKWVWPSDAASWVAFAVMGLAGMLGHQLSTIAHRFAPASTLAPFIYIQIVYMSASSWIFFQQPPDIWIFVGAPIIIGSGLYIWLRERHLSLPVTPVAETD